MPFTTNSTMTISTNGDDISKLLTAAVVNAKFRKLLISNPTQALANGYDGEKFRFSKDEQDQILSIRAQSLTDFAQQLIGVQDRNHIVQPVPVRTELRAYAQVGLD